MLMAAATKRCKTTEEEMDRLLENINSLDDFCNTVESRSFEPEDWYLLGFRACHLGKADILRWLIDSKNVPLLVQNEHGTLLHAAVRSNQVKSVEALVDLTHHQKAAVISLFCQVSSEEICPLEVAIQNDLENMFSLLTEIKFESGWLDSRMKEILYRVLQTENRWMRHRIGQVFRTSILSCLSGHESLPELKGILRLIGSGFMRNHSTPDWSELDKSYMYNILCTSVEKGSLDKVKWLFREWKISTRPPELAKANTLSIADRAVTAVGEVKFWMFEMDDVDDIKDKSLWKFNKEVVKKWDGNIDNLLDCKPKGLSFENLAYDCIADEDYEDRLAMIKTLSEKFNEDGAHCIPRLDILVFVGQLQILKFLVASGLVDLSSSLEKASAAQSTCLEKEEASRAASDEEEDDICAICLGRKWNPQQMECGHSYCNLCFRRLCDLYALNAPGYECPLCRRRYTVPVATSVGFRFEACLRKFSPWLKFNVEMPISEILLGLAAGTGSVFILAWLVCELKVDPRKVRFSSQNILHVAASRGHAVVCKWLCLNGYLDLATEQDSEGMAPIEAAMNGESKCCSLVVQVFYDLKLLPDNWTETASMSKNPGVLEIAKSAQASRCAASIPKLLQTSAPLDKVVSTIERSSLIDDSGSQGEMAKVVFTAVEYERFDVLRWVLAHAQQKFSHFLDKCTGLTFYQYIQNAIRKFGEKDTANAFLEEMRRLNDHLDNVEALKKEIKALVVQGEPVECIKTKLKQQTKLYFQLPPDFAESNKHTLVSLKSTVKDDLNFLQFCFVHGHLHLVEWALGQLQNELGTAEQIFQAVSIARFSRLQPSLKALQFLISWMGKNTIPLQASEFSLRNGEHGTECINILHLFVSSHAHALRKYRLNPGNCAALLDIIKFLCARDDIQRAVMDGKSHPYLFEYFSLNSVSLNDPKEEFISNQLLEVTKTLLSAGANMEIETPETQKKRNFVEEICSSGSIYFLDTIRWLALEKDVDIQYVNYHLDYRTTKIIPEYYAKLEADFEIIQRSQREQREAMNN